MFEPSGFRAAEVQFDKQAKPVGSTKDVLDLASDAGITDLIVMSHGWNNDIADASALYAKVAASMRSIVNGNKVAGLANRNVGLVGVFWPSKKFAEEDLIPGGAAAAASPISDEDVRGAIDDIRDLFPDVGQQAALDTAHGLVSQLEDKASARKQFATLLLSVLDPAAAEREDGTSDMFSVAPGILMDRLAVPAIIAPPQPAQGGALGLGGGAQPPTGPGGAAGLGSTLGGILGAAKNLLNGVTYYEMKARAGTVGEQGLAPLITQIRNDRSDLRIHFVGHSFGGRLVSAAASKLPKDTLASMTLLQAAFSHYGFAAEWSPGQAGGFRATITNGAVSGPIVITHTANDRAVGIAYAIASRIAGQNASAVGDANDTYGGIGRNGAQKTSEANFGQLLAVGGTYTWNAHVLHNLQADAFIKDHSDIKGEQVAYAIMSAIATT
jgi:pimeloyl-ACP methyl ester carboxylesterase